MSSNMPQISVVILCYKAEDFAPIFVSEMKKVLEKRGLIYELVLVGNYQRQHKQTDRTPQIVTALAMNDIQIRAVVKEKEGMMGWDMQTGLNVATADTIAIIDGDGQMPAEDVIRVYDKLIEGNYDMVKTYRNLRYDGSKRVFVSKIYNFLVKILFPRVKARDINSKPKIFTREMLDKLQLYSNDWFIDAEIVIQASYLRMSIGEIPTKFHVNKNRASFTNTATILEFLKNLVMFRIKYWFNKGNII